jgi:hypothetical protein
MKKKMDIPVRPIEMGVLIFVHEQASPVTPLNISQAFNMKNNQDFDIQIILT